MPEFKEGVIGVKSPRQRSVSYPSFSIQSCYDFVAKIDKTFSDIVFTPRMDISKALTFSGGSFLMQLSSCVQYELLELKSSDGYKPSARYKKIKRPLPTENVADFYLECFKSPELYKKLIADFSGKQLPEQIGLANMLDRLYAVVGAASAQAAKIFLKNATDLDLIDDDGVFNLKDATSVTSELIVEDVPPIKEVVPVLPAEKPIALPKPKQDVFIEFKTEYKEIPIFLKGNREAKILIPLDFTDEDLTKISKVLTGYLP